MLFLVAWKLESSTDYESRIAPPTATTTTATSTDWKSTVRAVCTVWEVSQIQTVPAVSTVWTVSEIPAVSATSTAWKVPEIQTASAVRTVWEVSEIQTVPAVSTVWTVFKDWEISEKTKTGRPTTAWNTRSQRADREKIRTVFDWHHQEKTSHAKIFRWFTRIREERDYLARLVCASTWYR